MANLSIEKLATVIGSEPEILLSQIKEAGLSHSKVSEEVTDADKKILLDFLKNQQTKTSKTISLNKTEPRLKPKETGSVAGSDCSQVNSLTSAVQAELIPLFPSDLSICFS